MKKVLRIIVIILVIIAVGIGLFWFFNKNESGSDSYIPNFNLGNFFPFGKSPEDTLLTNTPVAVPPTNSPQSPALTPSPALWKIYGDPQSGVITFIASGTPTVRFVDKATGNVYESFLDYTASQRISNTTLPKIYEALWLPNGESVVLRYLSESDENIQSLLAKLIPNKDGPTLDEPTLNELEGKFLPSNALAMSVDGQSGKIAYTTLNPEGGVNFYVVDANGEKTKQIFSSAVRDWSLSWVNSNTVAINTKASADVKGYLYFVRVDKGMIERVLGDIAGLLTNSNRDGTKILYAVSNKNEVSFGIYDREVKGFFTFLYNTLPEKCIWSTINKNVAYCSVPNAIPPAIYPDDWYKGKVSFSDKLWKIDVSNLKMDLITDPSKVEQEGVDAINLMLDPTEKFLVFTNKKDGSLWGLRLEENL